MFEIKFLEIRPPRSSLLLSSLLCGINVIPSNWLLKMTTYSGCLLGCAIALLGSGNRPNLRIAGKFYANNLLRGLGSVEGSTDSAGIRLPRLPVSTDIQSGFGPGGPLRMTLSPTV